MRQAFAAAGFTDVASVAAQAEPDGRFPTVAFPNPEEPGAMERVLAFAEERNADLVIANAGVGAPDSLGSGDPSALTWLMDVNVNGVFNWDFAASIIPL